jgi:CO/xanthine dehydrogenase Mo-binding subunit
VSCPGKIVTVSILGTRVIRTEDPRFLTTGGVYTEDMRLPGACHVHFVRSALAHARIAAIDVSAALEAPGVIAVFTGADLAGMPVPPPPMAGMINAEMGQPLLAAGVVRYVGEPVAVVVTEGRYQGEDAGDLVDVDYDVLTPVIDMTTAAVKGDGEVSGGAPLLFPTGARWSSPAPSSTSGSRPRRWRPGPRPLPGARTAGSPRGSRTRAPRAPAPRWPAC